MVNICGQYYIEVDNRELEQIAADIRRNFGSEDAPTAKYSGELIRPTDTVPTLALVKDRPTYLLQKWGFPGFGERPRLVINARAETVADKPMFREAYAQRRCVIPASGFFESSHADKRDKRKYAITKPEENILYMAGITRYYPVGNQPFPHFVVITTNASASMAGIHDRMPVLMEKDEQEEYLADSRYADIVLQRPGAGVLLREIEKPVKQLSLFG